MFSERSDRESEPDALALALSERRARGEPVVDLTSTAMAAIPHDDEAIRGALLASRIHPEPEPLGLASARDAIASELAREGVSIDPARIALTATRSEALRAIFTILGDPGDEVLVPEPCDRRLAELAHASGVVPVPYPLRLADGWRIDATELWELIGDRTRAILVLSPSVPLGSYLLREEAEALAALGLPLVVDEALASYPLEAPADRVRAATLDETLVFALEDLSARAALPGVNLAWTAVRGPEVEVAEALARLERTLGEPSVALPIQLALPALLASATTARRAIAERCAANLSTLRALTAGTAIEVPRVEGGWHACLRVTSADDERLSQSLSTRGVYAHPGRRYDFPEGEAWLVVSLLTPHDELERGVAALIELAS